MKRLVTISTVLVFMVAGVGWAQTVAERYSVILAKYGTWTTDATQKSIAESMVADLLVLSTDASATAEEKATCLMIAGDYNVVLIGSSKYAEALSQYDEAIAVVNGGRFEYCIHQKCVIYNTQGDIPNLEKAVNEALSKGKFALTKGANGQLAYIHYCNGIVKKSKADFAAAKTAFETAISLAPETDMENTKIYLEQLQKVKLILGIGEVK